MAHHSHSDQPNARVLLEEQVRECYGRVVYTHKTQEKRADILLARLGWIKFAQISLSIITTGGFLFAFFGYSSVTAIIGGVCSTVLLFINTYTKDHDLGQIAEKHRRAAADIWIIRERYLTLITEVRIGNKPHEEISAQHEALLVQLHSIYAGAPSTNYKAYEQAQTALQEKEEMTFSSKEIDDLLPENLRKGDSDMPSGSA